MLYPSPQNTCSKDLGPGYSLVLWISPSSFCHVDDGTDSSSHRDLDQKQLGSVVAGKANGLLRCGKARRFSVGLS